MTGAMILQIFPLHTHTYIVYIVLFLKKGNIHIFEGSVGGVELKFSK